MIVPNLTYVYDRKGQSSRTKTGVVELRITANRQRKYISTGVKLLPKEWSNGSVVGRMDWKELNEQLQVLKKKCSEIIVQMMDEGGLDLDALARKVKESMSPQLTFIEYCKGLAEVKYKNLAEGTRKHYKTLFDFLEEWKGMVSFSDVTESSVKKMDAELARRGLKECSRWNYHKRIQMFVKQALEDGLLKKNPYAKAGIKRGEEGGLSRCLSPEEFHKFEACDIPIQSLAKVRDLFVFQTYTMMSYSDLADFDYSQCVEVKGQIVYKSRRVKTGQEFVVVLVQQAMEILDRYNGKLPIISNVKYNLYLKNAVLYAKIDKPVSSHWARHTGATMLLNEKKIPIHIIQHILGHASIRETERTYAKMMDETIVDAMVRA